MCAPPTSVGVQLIPFPEISRNVTKKVDMTITAPAYNIKKFSTAHASHPHVMKRGIT